MKRILKLKNNIVNPLINFVNDSKSIGIILLASTLLSLILANIPAFGSSYAAFWTQGFDNSSNHHFYWHFLSLPNSPLMVINDFLMAIFFFLAGMEIKRELKCGELSTLKKSLLPIAAAIGGIIMPAVIFSQFTRGTEYLNGWAIPTATDIAFTLGVASLLGRKVPLALKVFITALAIIDDLGAILIIALFYGGSLHGIYLLGALACFGLLMLLNLQRKFNTLLFFGIGLVLWYCMFNSGIHPTIAGVLFAFTIPTDKLAHFEHQLHKGVYFFILPIFALANTAIILPSAIGAALSNRLSWGIIFGLLVGKPLGICLATYLMVKNKFAALPNRTNWYQLAGASILAGIGFTMSIFITTLAFQEEATQNISKIAVLLASFLAIIIGFVWLQKAPIKASKL